LYSSPNIIGMIKSRRMSWTGHVPRMNEKRNVYRVLVGKSEGKKPLGRPRREENTKINIRKMKWYGVDWVYVAQDSEQLRALVNTAMKLQVP
jgi:hypothetical protein